MYVVRFKKTLYQHLGCGGIIDLAAGQQQTIKSPNYPSAYSVDTECVWMIRVSLPFPEYSAACECYTIKVQRFLWHLLVLFWYSLHAFPLD